MNIRSYILSVSFGVMMLLSIPYPYSYASCFGTNYGPCSEAGILYYHSSYKTFVYCNGTHLVTMQGNGTDGACTGASEGELEYNSTLGNYRFCNGTNWIPLANNGASGGCSAAQELNYDASNNNFEWCDGVNWVDVSSAVDPMASSCVFVTSTSFLGNGFGGTSGADLECSNRAAAAGLSGKYKAWIADSGTHPAGTFNPSSVVYRDVKGNIIANDWTDLIDGSLLSPIQYDEGGTLYSGAAWTGTNFDGSSDADTCTDWTSGGGGSGPIADGSGGAAGSSSSTNTQWTDGEVNNYSCGSTLPLYCFEQPCDRVPDLFNFTDTINAEMNTVVDSTILQITGTDCPSTPVLVSGDPSAQFRVCSDSVCSSSPAFGTTGSIGPTNGLQELGSTTNGNLNGPRGVALSGSYAYVASYTGSSLTVIDISNSANPTQVGTVSTIDLNGASGVAVSGNYAFVASTLAFSLTVIDVSTPSSPTQVGTISSANLDGATGVAVSGSYAFVANTVADSLTVIDISTPTSPTEVATISSANLDGATGVAISGSYALVASNIADRLTVIDISVPSSPTEAGSVLDGTNLNGASGLAVAGNYAYVASNTGYLATVDFSTPSSPTVVGATTSANLNGAFSVALIGSYAYVAATSADRLTVIDISTPAIPVEVESLTNLNLDGARGVATDGTHAFVTGIIANSLAAFGFSPPQYIQLRVTSSATRYTVSGVTLDIGGVTDNWNVTTKGHKVFVTAATYKGNGFAGALGADTECATAASLAGLSGIFKAWISDSGSSPQGSFSNPTTAYTDVPGTTVIANSWTDLVDGTLLSPIQIDQDGNLTGATAVWTGTNFDGTADTDTCFDWTSGGGGTGATADGSGAAAGSPSMTNSEWTDGELNNYRCGSSLPIYCFEQ